MGRCSSPDPRFVGHHHYEYLWSGVPGAAAVAAETQDLHALPRDVPNKASGIVLTERTCVYCWVGGSSSLWQAGYTPVLLRQCLPFPGCSPAAVGSRRNGKESDGWVGRAAQGANHRLKKKKGKKENQ